MEKKMTVIRFDTTDTARQFTAAARRRGYAVKRSQNDVTAEGDRVQVESVIRQWALNRGSLPTYTVIDWV